MKPEEEHEIPKQLLEAANVFYYLLVSVLCLATIAVVLGV